MLVDTYGLGVNRLQLWHAVPHCLLTHQLFYFPIVLERIGDRLSLDTAQFVKSLGQSVLEMLPIEDELAMIDEILHLELTMEVLDPFPKGYLAFW